MKKEDDTEHDRKIDMFTKKTESEWAYAHQTFFEKLTPLWFKWPGWVFALGAVSYLAEKIGSMPLKVIESISYFILAFYFLFFFASFRVEPYHSWALSRQGKIKQFLALLPILLIALEQ